MIERYRGLTIEQKQFRAAELALQIVRLTAMLEATEREQEQLLTEIGEIYVPSDLHG